jgi:hypothetical protein
MQTKQGYHSSPPSIVQIKREKPKKIDLCGEASKVVLSPQFNCFSACSEKLP